MLFALSLNKVDVPVSGKKVPIRQVMAQGLVTALVRYSGNTHIDTVPDVRDALTDPQRYVRSYSLMRKPAPTESAATEPMLQSAQYRIVFDKEALIALLKKSQQAIWLGQRPLVLFSVQLGTDEEASSAVVQEVDTLAQQWGLSLMRPTMDLSDRDSLQQVTEMQSLTAMQQLSTRYGVSVALVGELQLASESDWRATWSLLLDGEILSWQQQAQTRQAVLKASLSHLLDVLASHFAVLADDSQAHALLLTVSHVEEMADYASITHYLTQLPAVADVEMAHIGVDGMTFKVTLRSSTALFLQQVRQAGHLLQTLELPVNENIEDSSDPVAEPETLYFKWEDAH